MTVQNSQRGKEYLETAQTLLRAAKTMTDLAIAAAHSSEGFVPARPQVLICDHAQPRLRRRRNLIGGKPMGMEFPKERI